MGSQRTKEDDVQRISTSVFVTNFPEYACAKDLWNACKEYGYVVDAFIPNRISKAGKKFRFMRQRVLTEVNYPIGMGSIETHQMVLNKTVEIGITLSPMHMQLKDGLKRMGREILIRKFELASFTACIELHKLGALTDNLVPDTVEKAGDAKEIAYDFVEEQVQYVPPELLRPMADDSSKLYHFYSIKFE
ncbi:nucleotide-binding alpha-beta plait domain-containing protein [Tanacetum coccineum]|uniref:Nucleotide-binding alpha-beta plait domain-containing protein n=1 Tax=Tanacetum coccineum TaxID=301880 RepID=A0ABQ5ESC4_9ASTR